MKRKKLVAALLCMLLCCGLALSACTSEGTPSPSPATDPPATNPPAPSGSGETYAVDFSDGKTGFLLLNTGTPDTDKDAAMEVVSLDGGSALKLTAPNGGALRLGVSVDRLLGGRAADVRTAVFDVYAEYPDGTFRAVAGRITAYRGALDASSSDIWTVYLATRNPNEATATLTAGEEFVSGGPNIFEFTCTTHGPADNGET
ncbi:MAG: hypothetical protein FWG93_00315, partial [Oscillospiraceae bacterium]|nr:hypothetical protein [Oscillospiraceae bacterium]